MKVHLSAMERRWARAIYDTIFPGPSRGHLPYGVLDMDLDGFLDQTMSTIPLEPAIGLRLAIWVVALTPIFFVGKLASIASLSVEDREKHMLAIASHRSYPIRSTIVALKAIGSLFYCGDARLRPLILATSDRDAYVKLVQLRPIPKKRALSSDPPAPEAPRKEGPHEHHAVP